MHGAALGLAEFCREKFSFGRLNAYSLSLQLRGPAKINCKNVSEAAALDSPTSSEDCGREHLLAIYGLAKNPVSFDCISKMPQESIFPCVHPARSIGLLASLSFHLDFWGANRHPSTMKTSANHANPGDEQVGSITC